MRAHVPQREAGVEVAEDAAHGVFLRARRRPRPHQQGERAPRHGGIRQEHVEARLGGLLAELLVLDVGCYADHAQPGDGSLGRASAAVHQGQLLAERSLGPEASGERPVDDRHVARRRGVLRRGERAPFDERRPQRLEQRGRGRDADRGRLLAGRDRVALDREAHRRAAVVRGDAGGEGGSASLPAGPRDAARARAAARHAWPGGRRRRPRRRSEASAAPRPRSPTGAACSRRKLRIIRLAPTSRARLRATCPTTSAEWSRWGPAPAPPREPSRRSETRSGRDERQAGSRPERTAASAVTPVVNSTLRQSRPSSTQYGSSSGQDATTSSVNQAPSQEPERARRPRTRARSRPASAAPAGPGSLRATREPPSRVAGRRPWPGSGWPGSRRRSAAPPPPRPAGCP